MARRKFPGERGPRPDRNEEKRREAIERLDREPFAKNNTKTIANTRAKLPGAAA